MWAGSSLGGSLCGKAGGRRTAQGGYTLVVVLLLLALVSLGLAQAGPLWSQQVRREREQELLRIGRLYALALASYREASPGSLKQFPDRLDALLRDTRFVGTVRHLRMLYPDPVNPGQPWGLVRDDGGRVVGVRSLSSDAPLAARPVLPGGRPLLAGPQAYPQAAQQYKDWIFLAPPAP